MNTEYGGKSYGKRPLGRSRLR